MQSVTQPYNSLRFRFRFGFEFISSHLMGCSDTRAFHIQLLEGATIRKIPIYLNLLSRASSATLDKLNGAKWHPPERHIASPEPKNPNPIQLNTTEPIPNVSSKPLSTFYPPSAVSRFVNEIIIVFPLVFCFFYVNIISFKWFRLPLFFCFFACYIKSQEIQYNN